MYSDLYLIEFDNYSQQLQPGFGFKSQISFKYVNNKFTVTVIKIETEPEKGFAKKMSCKMQIECYSLVHFCKIEGKASMNA